LDKLRQGKWYCKMNLIIKRLKAFTSRNLIRKFPEASLPIFKKLALEPTAVTVEDIMSSIKQFEFDDVWLLHGVAMKRKGGATVLSGPVGIGKSTLLRKVTRSGLAEPLDDGFILVGRVKGCYYVLASGLYPVIRTISIISKSLRMLFRCQSPYLNTNLHRDLTKARKREKLLHDCAVLIGSIVTKGRRSERVISRPVRLAKLFLVTHQSDCNPPRRIHGDTIEFVKANEATKLFNNYLSCEVICSYEEGLGKIISKRIFSESKS
jgi:hypothetical protein